MGHSNKDTINIQDFLAPHSYLNDYFDHIYVVNLKTQISNKLIITKHLNKYGINFEIYEALNGYEGDIFEKFHLYQQRNFGDLKRYPKFSKLEEARGDSFIESAGAMGYIHTYIQILEDAKKNKYKQFLILEDDILLDKNFENKFKKFIHNIDKNWKILQLGASQYAWDNVDINKAIENKFYFPRILDTCGSFAIAFNSSIIDELIEAESALEAPFDHLPMGELYEKYLGKCFVAYPNIVMPDVSKSSIRGGRCQYMHSEKMKWKIQNFNYPLEKPSISIVITSKNNLKYYSNFSKTKKLPFNIRLFFNSIDGLRPLHNIELLDTNKNKIYSFTDDIYIPESHYVVTINKEEILSESDIIKFLEYKINIRKNNVTPLREIKTLQKDIKTDRVSVIIPTYKRPKNLKNALTSIVIQDYQDIEVIVVSDNGKDSTFIEETRQIVSSFYNKHPNCNVVLLEHLINRNGAAARNTGIMHATGEYICFLDDDDIYLQGRLSKSIEKLKIVNKDVAAVYCGFTGWNSLKNDLNRYKTGDLTLEILLLDYKKHYLHTNTATYRRDAVLSLNGFDESYIRHQDLEFNIRFFEQYKIDAIQEILVNLRPEPTDINNMAYGTKMLEVKQKFLNQFSYIIKTYDSDFSTKIYERHWAETKKFLSNPNDIVKQIDQNFYSKLTHDRNMFQKEYNILQNKYNQLSESITKLANLPIKTKPLKKFSQYKSLLDTYYKQKK